MKKLFTLFAATLIAALSFGQSYGILVNGTTYYEGTLVDEFEGFTQYLAHVQVNSGDYCQLYDAENEAAWAVPLNTSSVDGFTLNGDRYDVTVDGCYDFYIKLKYQADELYIGPGTDCGGGGGGDNPPSGGAKDYFIKGYIAQGVNIETPTAEEQFEHGILDYTFAGADGWGYFFILICDKGQVIGEQYMAMEYTTGKTHATMTKAGQEKIQFAAGTVRMYLYDNEDGTYELSIEELPGKKLVDSGESAIDEVNASLDRNQRRYNVFGQEVDDNYRGIVIQNGRKYLQK